MTNKNQDLNEALDFLKLFAGEDGKVHITAINKANKKVTDQIVLLIDKGMENLARLNKKGYDIYFVPNKTDLSGKRSAKSIEKVRALFIDIDDTSKDNLPIIQSMSPKPSIVVQTSPNKFHCYWLVNDCALEEFKNAQKALIAKFQSDPSVNDLPRLMRVPEFYNHKNEKRFLTRVLEV
jgi:hypothetical protein